MFKRFKNKKHQQQPSSARQKEEGGSGGREPSLNGILRNGHGQQEMGHGSSPPRQSVERYALAVEGSARDGRNTICRQCF
jgi:hypothetical protein